MSCTVSIILPTYNRARFLPEAIQSIREQQFVDWELIVVDDGSTDETPELIKQLTADTRQPIRYVRQENQGAYAARNTGLDHAAGNYVAFFDSDDLWLPHHLKHCVEALEANPDVDWVYGACRLFDTSTGQIVADNSFYKQEQPRQFLKLNCQKRGMLHVLEDDRCVATMIQDGMGCGIQCSVISRKIFLRHRFSTEPRNESEDQVFSLRVLLGGGRFAYFDDVHTVYRFHDNQHSAAGTSSFDRRVRVLSELVRGYEIVLKTLPLNHIQRSALRKRLSEERFWTLGYSIYWQHGLRSKAFHEFRNAIWLWPWEWRYWKTISLCGLRKLFGHEHEMENDSYST